MVHVGYTLSSIPSNMTKRHLAEKKGKMKVVSSLYKIFHKSLVVVVVVGEGGGGGARRLQK